MGEAEFFESLKSVIEAWVSFARHCMFAGGRGHVLMRQSCIPNGRLPAEGDRLNPF